MKYDVKVTETRDIWVRVEAEDESAARDLVSAYLATKQGEYDAVDEFHNAETWWDLTYVDDECSACPDIDLTAEASETMGTVAVNECPACGSNYSAEGYSDFDFGPRDALVKYVCPGCGSTVTERYAFMNAVTYAKEG